MIQPQKDPFADRVTLCRAKYDLLIGPLRVIARERGYALAVHGSLARDIDLVAAPWTREAVSSARLIADLFRETERVNGAVFWSPNSEQNEDLHRMFTLEQWVERCGTPRPHGRMVWSIYFESGDEREPEGPYMDVSVMPRVDR